MSAQHPRTPCVIDGCGRSTAKPFAEWICGKHWAALTKAEKRAWGRLKRRARYKPEKVSPEAFLRIWRRCKTIAATHRAGAFE
jgi:hypothetical protein